MKHLLLAALTALLLVGCQSSDDMGRPGDETGTSEEGTTTGTNGVPERNPSNNLRPGWNK